MKTMKLPWFVSVNLIILVALVHVYHWAKSNYDEKDILTYKVKKLTYELQQSKLEVAVLEDRFLGFRQEIAANLPSLLKTHSSTPEGYHLRSIASVTQTPNQEKREQSRETIARIKFETARKAFHEKRYAEAANLLESFISDYGFSPRAPEAYFLLVESLYQEGRTEEAVEKIQRMIDLFPGHEVAGFSMIRLGRIMEDNGRVSDAIDVYKTVLKTFPQREVAAQAKSSLAGVGY